MRFSIVALVAPLLLAGSALAGYNCKCQDFRGQFNEYTENCCNQSGNILNTYHGDQVHQCSNPFGGLDSGAFVQCCQRYGINDAFCWQ
ncbi:hypothetical protein Q9L58_005359 [Maublancomyces gigas]|uniref:Uncharacterized protein n=1 Tax=Discina gigas TaxID=1032678 RepID=A0ABR3GIF1_9PEZI